MAGPGPTPTGFRPRKGVAAGRWLPGAGAGFRRLLPALLLLPGTGCAGEGHLLERWLAGSQTALVHGSPWTWLALPLVGLVMVEALSLLLERRRAGAPAPGGADGGGERRQAFLLWGLLVAAALALAFAALNVVAPIEPADKLRNVGLWFLGTLAGAAAALLLAWRFQGVRRPDPSFPSRADSATPGPD